MNRRHFLQRTGTAALAAAVLPFVSTLPVPPAVPTLEQQAGRWNLTEQLKDPEVAETFHFMLDVAERQLSDDDVDHWVAKLDAWGFQRPAHVSDRELAAAAALSLWTARQSLAEFRAFHAETHPKAQAYFELEAAVQRDRAAAT